MDVLVVSDDPRLIEWLVATLGMVGWAVRSTGSPSAAIEILTLHTARLVLTDQRASQLSEGWLAGCWRHGARVVVVTPRTIEGQLEASLAAGADGFVQCPVGSHELVARLRAIARRGPRVELPEPARATRVELGALVLDRASGEVSLHGRPIRLTVVELGILEALMVAAPNVVPRDELIRRASRVGTVPVSLDLQVRRLRTCLEAEEGWRRIDAVRGVGFRALPQPPSTPTSPDGRPTFTTSSVTGHEQFGPPREPVSP